MRITRADVMELKPTSESIVHRAQRAKHSRRILKFVQPSGEHHSEDALSTIERRLFENFGVNRNRHEVDQTRSAGKLVLYLRFNVGIDTDDGVSDADRCLLHGSVHEPVFL